MRKELSEMEVSTKPITMLDHRLLQGVMDNDWEALFQLILNRTNLLEEFVDTMDNDEINYVTIKVSEAITQACELEKLGKLFTNEEI